MANGLFCFACTFLFHIRYYTDRRGDASCLMSFSSLLHLKCGRLCPSQGSMPRYPLISVHLTLIDIGLRIKGESPDGTPHMISVSSYKCTMCTDCQCYPRVSRLFLLEFFVAPSSESAAFTAHAAFSLHCPSALAARLPRARVPTAPPRASDLSPCLTSLCPSPLPP